MQLGLSLVLLSCVALAACESSECDRLGVRDAAPWVVMDCPASKVRARVSGGTFEFSCEGEDEHYEGQWVLAQYQDDALVEYSAVMNEEDGCHWTREDGGEDSCVGINGTDYPEDCTDGGGSTTIYY